MLAMKDVDITAAYANALDFDQNLTGLGLGHRHFLECNRFGRGHGLLNHLVSHIFTFMRGLTAYARPRLVVEPLTLHKIVSDLAGLAF
jgi:hypothetical protein